MDCDVEEVPSTDSELTGSADSASAITCIALAVGQHCLRFRMLHGPARQLRSFKTVAEPRNHMSGPTSLKIRITRTQYVLSASYPPSVS